MRWRPPTPRGTFEIAAGAATISNGGGGGARLETDGSAYEDEL